jgi:hypothetical protein
MLTAFDNQLVTKYRRSPLSIKTKIETKISISKNFSKKCRSPLSIKTKIETFI